MYYFIINPKSRSGQGKAIWDLVKERLDELQIQYQFYYTKHKSHATELTTYLCNNVSGRKEIVVLGGDGTINEVINGIVNFEEVCLSYIPTGSSNDFARSLKIPSNWKDSLSIVLDPPKQVNVDIGELEICDSSTTSSSTQRFAVSSGIGYDATICYEALNSRLKNFLNKLRLGKLTYGLIAAKQVLCYKFTSGDLIIDGKDKQHHDDILFLVGMVHPFEGGGAKLAPNADYQDQKLSVCFVHGMKRWKTLFLLPTAFAAKHTKFHGVTIFDCETLELLQTDSKVTHTDGEFSGKAKHIRMCCNRHHLLVNAPL